MGGFGSLNTARDPMRNAALSAQFTNYEQTRDNAPVSDAKRKAAYVAMGILGAVIVGIIALFVIM